LDAKQLRLHTPTDVDFQPISSLHDGFHTFITADLATRQTRRPSHLSSAFK
jgi:hypothetical protein